MIVKRSQAPTSLYPWRTRHRGRDDACYFYHVIYINYCKIVAVITSYGFIIAVMLIFASWRFLFERETAKSVTSSFKYNMIILLSCLARASDRCCNTWFWVTKRPMQRTRIETKMFIFLKINLTLLCLLDRQNYHRWREGTNSFASFLVRLKVGQSNASQLHCIFPMPLVWQVGKVVIFLFNPVSRNCKQGNWFVDPWCD